MNLYLSFMALWIVPLGVVFAMTKIYSSGKPSARTLSGGSQGIRTNNLAFRIAILSVFPLLLLVYQMAHGPRRLPLLFLLLYMIFAAGITVFVASNVSKILNTKEAGPGLSALEMVVAAAGLLGVSLYIAWISAIFTSLEIFGRLWRGNILLENVIDGLFGFVVGILCFGLIRAFRAKNVNRAPYLWLMALTIFVVFWIYFGAKAGMPLYFRIPRILSFPPYNAFRFEDLVFPIVFFLQAILCQVVIPLLIVLNFLKLRKKVDQTGARSVQ